MSLSSGQLLSHYKILKHLGGGGMGEIYLVEDTKLGREVVLKLLPPDFATDSTRMRRFTQEAKAASALNHPNVAHLYELGEADGFHFIIMEYVAGKTILEECNTEKPNFEKILNMAIQIADALDEAHSNGILHRDIKPSNIMITSRGRIKVLDFGLAKIMTEGVETDSALNTLSQTAPGTVLGTVPYMSPEQILGRPLDVRSDIFSLGVTFYQMVTWRLPFNGASTNEVIDQILHTQPVAISRFNYNVTPEFEKIIRKCIEKDPERRYQSTRELLIDLKNLQRDMTGGQQISSALPAAKIKTRSAFLWIIPILLIIAAIAAVAYLRTSHGKVIRSIAVLPFTNSSADSKTQFLSDGITESIINSLSQLHQLRVLARSSVFTYKNTQGDLRTVGRDLKVDAVVTGSILQQGNIILVQANLVDVSDGAQLWGEQYNSGTSNVLAIQSDISRKISDNLRLQLTGNEKQLITKQFTENNDAYQLYIQGRYYWNKRSEEGLRKAIEFFQDAIKIDPNYALAYAGLADCYDSLGFNYDAGASNPREIMPKAEAAALKSLELDPNLAEGHTSLAFVRLNYDWDWPGAEKEFQEAIHLNPNYAQAHHWYSHYLTAMGRTNDSLSESKTSLQLDPLARIINVHLGWHYVFARQPDLAIGQLKKSIEMNEFDYQAHWYLGVAYSMKLDYPQAIKELEYAVSLMHGSPETKGELGYLYGISGNRQRALQMLNELEELSTKKYVSPYLRAQIYLSLGDKDQTFHWLQEAYDARSDALVYLKVDPRLDPLRNDPRFVDLLRRMKL